VSLLLSLLLSGCNGAGPAPSSSGPTSAPSNATQAAEPNRTFHAPPPPVEVFNATFPFNAGSTDPPKSMSLEKAGARLSYVVSVRTRDANAPTFLQPEQGQTKAYILFKPPSGMSGRQDLDAILQTTPAVADLELKRYEGGVGHAVEGSWTVEAHGVGNNLRAVVVVRELFD
jgi:hypothetical protein